MEWSVVTIDDWSIAGIETQGRHEHFWFSHPAEKRTWLFKPARVDRQRSAGEDVAEKLGSDIARLFGVPAATVVLARRDGVRGALVEDARPPGWELQPGQTLMMEVVPDYDPSDSQQRGHNVRQIQRALQCFGPPPQADVPSDFTAFDMFAGYLAFDALVAHGDRHDRNWAVLRPPSEADVSDALCASFDHAAVLGLLQTEQAIEHLRGRSVADWAGKSRASRFEHRLGSPWQTLVDLAGSAVALCPPSTVTHWRNRIQSVDAASIKELVLPAPGLSETTQLFITDLVMANRRRLIDVIG